MNEVRTIWWRLHGGPFSPELLLKKKDDKWNWKTNKSKKLFQRNEHRPNSRWTMNKKKSWWWLMRLLCHISHKWSITIFILRFDILRGLHYVRLHQDAWLHRSSFRTFVMLFEYWTHFLFVGLLRCFVCPFILFLLFATNLLLLYLKLFVFIFLTFI